jgi:hypothetical protein
MRSNSPVGFQVQGYDAPVGVFLRHGDRLIPMREQVYQAESVLEALLAESPALLAGDDDAGTRRLLLAGRIDDRVGPDYLFLDQEGIPTLVEVTRSADPEASRELVGQMVDYAANVVAYQDPAAIQAMLESRCRAEGRDVQDVLHEDLGVDMEPRHFWEHVRVNMSVGRMRLIFAADAIPLQLRRIVEFMNEQMSPTEILALEIRQYVEDAGRQHTLVTRVFGWTAAAQRRKGRGPGRAAWTWEDFRRALPKPQFEVAQALARELDAAIVQRGLDWKPEFRRSSIAYQRPGGYSVVLIELAAETPVRLAIKLPDEPRALGLGDPYPDLLDDWNDTTRQWSWQVASPHEVPEVERAIEIAEQYHPTSGPMTVGRATKVVRDGNGGGAMAMAPPAAGA